MLEASARPLRLGSLAHIPAVGQAELRAGGLAVGRVFDQRRADKRVVLLEVVLIVRLLADVRVEREVLS